MSYKICLGIHRIWEESWSHWPQGAGLSLSVHQHVFTGHRVQDIGQDNSLGPTVSLCSHIWRLFCQQMVTSDFVAGCSTSAEETCSISPVFSHHILPSPGLREVKKNCFCCRSHPYCELPALWYETLNTGVLFPSHPPTVFWPRGPNQPGYLPKCSLTLPVEELTLRKEWWDWKAIIQLFNYSM